MRKIITASRTGKSGTRPRDDFYPTEPGAVAALIDAEAGAGCPFPRQLWEPACGDGAISKVFENQGFDVISTDLNDHGFGMTGVDFLLETRALADTIVTNPPYTLADAFARKAASLAGIKRFAFLLRLAYLEGERRRDILESAEFGLSRVHVFRNRLKFAPGGQAPDGMNGTIAFAWFVWQPGYTGMTTVTRVTCTR